MESQDYQALQVILYVYIESLCISFGANTLNLKRWHNLANLDIQLFKFDLKIIKSFGGLGFFVLVLVWFFLLVYTAV